MSKNRQTGMTLIEILIVVLVVSVGMAATAKFQGELLQSGATTKARTQALSHAQNAVEALRIDHGGADNRPNDCDGPDDYEDDTTGSSALYCLKWEDPGDDDFTDAKQYSATVSWSGADGHSEKVQLDMVLYADPMLGGSGADDNIRADAAECVFFGCSSSSGPFVAIVSVDVEDNVNPDGSWAGVEDPTSNTTYDSGNQDLNLGNSTSVTTDDDDKVHVGKNLNGDIDLQEGDNKLAIDKDMNGNISAGSGDDQIDLGKDANGNINLGGGDNKLLIGKDMNGNLDLGSGSDEVIITKDANRDYINLGNGNNYLEIGKDSNVSISSGNGNDSINIGKNANQGPIDLGEGYNKLEISQDANVSIFSGDDSDFIDIGKDANQGPINLSNGYNYLKIGKDANIPIFSGDQADYIWIEKNKNSSGAVLGNGDDYLYIGKNNNSPVDMGNGNDFVCIMGEFYSYFEGGIGNDSIYLGKFSQAKWESDSWRHHYLRGFENIKFSDGYVQGDPSAFDSMTDDNCVKEYSGVIAAEYSKKYTININVDFSNDEAVNEVIIINLVVDSFLPDSKMILDTNGNGSFILLTNGLIPEDKEFKVESNWVSETPPKLKITVKLVDK